MRSQLELFVGCLDRSSTKVGPVNKMQVLAGPSTTGQGSPANRSFYPLSTCITPHPLSSRAVRELASDTTRAYLGLLAPELRAHCR